MKRFYFFYEGKITVVVVSLNETRTRSSSTEAEKEKERAREREKQKNTELKKRTDAASLSTPLLSLCFCFPKLSPARAKTGSKTEEIERKKKKKKKKKKGTRARRRGGGRGSAKTAVFFRALRVLGFLIRSARVFLYLGAAQKQKLKYSKENFCDHRFKTKRRPKERKTKGEEFFSNFSASSSSFSTVHAHPSTRIFEPFTAR